MKILLFKKLCAETCVFWAKCNYCFNMQNVVWSWFYLSSMCLKAAESPYETGTKCDSCHYVIPQMLVWDAQSAVLYFCCSKQVHAVVLEVACINNTHYLVFFKLFYQSTVLAFTMLETNIELTFFSLTGVRDLVFEMRCWCYAVLVRSTFCIMNKTTCRALFLQSIRHSKDIKS